MDSTSQTAADDTFDIVGVNRGKEVIKKLVVQLKEKIKELETNKESIQKLLIGYDREKTLANQANAVKLEMANKMKEAFETTLWYAQARNFIDNLMVKLKEKEEQLQEKNHANQELLAELEKARAVQATPGSRKLKTELAIAHTTVGALQKAFWKSFPSPHHYYHIKAPSGKGGYVYLCADYFGFLCSSPSDGLKGHFKFEKDPDGTFAIYSMAKAKYLQIQPSSGTSALSVMFCANAANKSKVSLIFHDHQDKQLPGILVDIFSMANGCFLSPSAILQNQFAANLVKAPANKFLIVAAEVEWNDVKMEMTSEDL